MQMGQLEPILSKVDSSVQEMQMGLMGSVSNVPAAHPHSLSNKPVGLMDPFSSNPGFPRFSMSNVQTVGGESKANSLGFQQLKPNGQIGLMETMPNNAGFQQLSASIKRKAPVEPVYNNTALQQLSLPNKRIAQLEHRPWLQQVSGPNKKSVQMQYMSATPGSQTQIKKVASSKSGSQRSAIPKNQMAAGQPSPKVQTESSESVRSKMRESLAGALTLVSQQKAKSSSPEKHSQSDIASASGQIEKTSHPAESLSNAADAPDGVSIEPKSTFPYQRNKNGGSEDELLQGNGLSWVLESDMQVAEKREIHTAKELEHDELGRVPNEEAIQTPQMVAFKIEAELFKLFGGVNKKYKEKGRSLLFNLKDRNNPELRERVMSGNIPPERLCSMTAEELASEELSQWRIAKAEEFAQMVVLPDAEVDIRRLVRKTHKGEFQVELEQDDGVSMDVSVGASSLTRRESNIKEAEGLMVDDMKDADFLPPIVSLDEFMESLDSEPPFENLPVGDGKKTPIPDKDESEPRSASKSSEPTPKEDMATDEPAKSDVTYSKTDADQKCNEDDGGVKSSDGHDDMKPSDCQTDVKYNESNTGADVNSSVSHAEVKSSESYSDCRPGDNRAKSEIVPPAGVSTGAHVWEGSLQLSTSAVASVVGIFKSGERISAKEWPSSLEIKGRVRLDAFEKFLQELPLSRSRAVMVMHFVVGNGSLESEQASLLEVADSYVSDERVGFAEPAPGVELYFCPPHKSTLEILPTEHVESLNKIDNGLIGVIVWRKAQLTSRISINSSSHQKHKKQNVTSSTRQQQTNMNASFTPKSNPPRGLTPTNFKPSPDDEDDDVPPGFGPRDEDDLPEFKFSGGSVPSSQHNFVKTRGLGPAPIPSLSQTPSRPVDQIRELIHKYGQPQAVGSSGNWQDDKRFGVAVQPWNDDDDDIPEWQPQAPRHQLPPQQSIYSFQQPILRPHLVNQPPLGSTPQQPSHESMVAMQSLQPSMNVTQVPQGTWWVPTVQGSGQQPSNLASQPNVGQFYGVPGRGVVQPGVAWRQNAPQSGGV
ncbi:hypothetical protein CIPAW_08G015500 [Carya illinoinensis]|uniref:TFIIS central domain-containing protein n=1 Tax=Carya illinoinensis TaxID=32201 RepID=A0A8T1PLS5_CARIL|nr:hypothetical protein CIPAW_08G015500 [Carya illinoinensis]KAG6643855.1 hypothetical protein CIPAW_08G015500 [Carya illinoinensis]